jgi:adenylosuccinate synthase
MTCPDENSIVVGLQWGNEGKERIIDFLAKRSDVIVRFQGCSNGGHVIFANSERFNINYLPTGIQYAGKKCLICGGVTLDLENVSEEIRMAKNAGILKAQLMISTSCHLILDYHKKLDVLDGRILGHDHNRTMNEPGFGHCCADKYRRFGVRVMDLLNPATLHDKLEQNLIIKNEYFTNIYGEKPMDVCEIFDKCLKLGEVIRPYAGDPAVVVEKAAESSIGILMEGCDGTLNDVDFGLYPYVMPLSAISAAAFAGTGMRQNMPVRIIGVAKSYCTRTDNGPFITEEFSVIAPFLRNRGNEFTEITGEPRRIGWLDLPALRYAIKKNNAHLLAITKLDVLTGIDELKICTAYMVDGKERKDFDLSAEEMQRAVPVYEIMEGWKEELPMYNDFNALPLQAKAYIKFIEESTDTSVIWVGVGSEWGNALFRRS